MTTNSDEKSTPLGQQIQSALASAPAPTVRGYCDTMRTCSQQPNAGAELQVRDAQYRALYETAISGILLTRPDGRIFAANPAACRLLGRSEQELRTLTRLDLVKPGDPRVPILLAQREETGRYQGELTLLRADGSVFEAEVASVVTPTEDGTFTSMVIHDLSERMRTEARIKELAQWLDKANEAIFVTDLDHRIIYWNQGAERMGGWTAAMMVGQHFSNLLERIGVSDPQTLAVAGQLADWRGTVSCRHRNGTPQVAATSVTVLRDTHGQPTGRLCISADITEQTRLQEKCERALRLQSIGMLAAGVAHDLNNILTPISLSAQMLRAGLAHRDDLELLETIQTCVARGAAMTRQILGFARGVGSEARAIQVAPILREVADIVRETFPRSITLEAETPKDLWPVMANPTQIHQVLLNLCVNARDAMPQGGRLRLGSRNCVLDEEAAASIAGANKGAWLVLSIEDTGTGIAPEHLTRMWEPFFTTKSVGMGSGLGLSTVREIVEAHAGFISVESSVGRGAAFRVFLPAIGSGVPGRESSPPQEVSRGNGERILVVDDEPFVRDTAKSVLTKAGYNVLVGANGAVALEMIKSRPEHFDLVLTDIDMPELDGGKLAQALKVIRPNLKVIAMSGLASKSGGLSLGSFSGGFLAKPFTVDLLLNAVRRALSRANVAPASAFHSSLPGR